MFSFRFSNWREQKIAKAAFFAFLAWISLTDEKWWSLYSVIVAFPIIVFGNYERDEE